MLTPEYLSLQSIKSYSNNAKIYYGEKIPTIMFDSSIRGTPMQTSSTDSSTATDISTQTESHVEEHSISNMQSREYKENIVFDDRVL
jgi:hypothetical protein